MTVTDFWSPANAPALRPLPFPLDEDAPDCLSRLYVPKGSPLVLGNSLACTVDHLASGLGWLHGAVVAGHCTEWTTAEAVQSLTVWLAAQGPRCSEGCGRQVEIRGRCRPCENHEQAADNYETEMEAA